MPRIKIKPSTTSGNRRAWYKHVTSVDVSKNTGYAFDGDFLPTSTEIDILPGAIVIECRPEGSVKNNWKSGHIYKVKDDGEMELIEGGFYWRKDFLSFRDKVAELVNQVQEPPNPLAEYSDQEILDEAKRRKLV